jgi:transposase
MTDRNERCPGSADETVQDIGEATRRKFSAEEKIRIVLQNLHGEETIAEPTGWKLHGRVSAVRT